MDARLVVPVSGRSADDRRHIRHDGSCARDVGRVGAARTTAVIRSLLSAGDVSVDVEYHIGYHTLLACATRGPERAGLRVRAVRNRIRRTSGERLAQCGGQRHDSSHGGRGIDGRALVVEPPPGDTGEASAHDRLRRAPRRTPEPEEVAVRSVASVVRPGGRTATPTREVDVEEGFEPEVLRGVAGLFAEGHSPALVVEVHPGSARETVAALERLGWTVRALPFELVRVPSDDRFASVPPPRDLDLEDVERRCFDGTVNVLLLAERLTRARAGGRSS